MRTNTPPKSKSTSHRQRKRAAMVQQILDTAREIMRAEGVAAFSMHELARRLGIRAPSLYHYFDGKMDILDALFRLGFTLYGEMIQAILEEKNTWQEQIRASMDGYMTFALRHPELYQLCFERPVPGFVPSQASLELSFSILHNSYAQVENWKTALNTTLPANQIVDLVIAMSHGLTALHIANEPHLPVGEGRFGSLIQEAVHVFESAWSGTTHEG